MRNDSSIVHRFGLSRSSVSLRLDSLEASEGDRRVFEEVGKELNE